MKENHLSLFANIFILIFLIFFSGIISVFFGLTIDWDFLNYHLYNPFAFLTGRMGNDLAPCGVHSFFNPILDIPYYLMFKHFINTQWVIAFFQGSYFGILTFILFKINLLLFRKTAFNRMFFSVIATAFGVTEVIIFSIFGTTHNDIQIALLILLAFYFLLKNILLKNSTKRIFFISLSAFLAGACLGLKFSFYLLAFILLIICFFKPLQKRKNFLSTLFLFIFFGAIGFLVTDGYFAYTLYQHFSNPIFPFFNKFFKSEMFPLINKTAPESAFLTFGLKSIAVNPFYWSFHPLSVLEIEFFDLKHIFAYISFFGLIIMSLKNKIKLNFRWKILMFFVFISYIIWSNTISVIRYLVPILALSGSIIIFFFLNILKALNHNDLREQKLYCVILLLFSFLNYTPVEIAKSTEKIVIPDLKIPNNSLVLFSAKKLSYLIVGNNPTAKYIGLCLSWSNQIPLSEKYSNYVKEQIKEHDNIYLIGSQEWYDYLLHDKNYFIREFNIYYTNCRSIAGITQGKSEKEDLSAHNVICDVHKK